jgi:chromosome partitioning protein
VGEVIRFTHKVIHKNCGLNPAFNDSRIIVSLSMKSTSQTWGYFPHSLPCPAAYLVNRTGNEMFFRRLGAIKSPCNVLAWEILWIVVNNENIKSAHNYPSCILVCADLVYITTPLRNNKGDSMIILVGSQKGGCGKSTIVVNLCAQLAALGKTVALVDTDKQGTASAWAEERNKLDNITFIPWVRCYELIYESLMALEADYDYVVVDVAGRDSEELREALAVAHMMIIPFRPSQADMDTLHTIQSIVLEVKKELNTDLKVAAVMTMAPVNYRSREIQDALEYLQEFPHLPPAQSIIKDRQVYRDAITEAKGVAEMANPKARQEIKLLTEELLSW